MGAAAFIRDLCREENGFSETQNRRPSAVRLKQIGME